MECIQNNRRRMLFMYFIMVCALILHIFLDEQISMKIQNLFNYKVLVLTTIARIINIIYYILLFYLFLAMGKIEKTGMMFDICLLGVPALFLMAMSVVITDKFVWIYGNHDYFIPFATMVMCILFKRIQFNRKV